MLLAALLHLPLLLLLLLLLLLQLLPLPLLLSYPSLLWSRCQHTARTTSSNSSSSSNDRLPLGWLEPASRSFPAPLLLFSGCLLLQLAGLLLSSQYALQYLMDWLL
jgi:hypothetical protein